MAESGTTPSSEADLVSGLRARDEAAFATLVDQWGPTMQRAARGHVSTDAVAEEVVQDTWVAVLRGIDRFEGRSSLRTWVFRILANTAKTRGIRERRTIPMSSLAGSLDAGPTVGADRFRGDGDEHPGGWKRFPADWPVGVTGEHRVLGEEVGGVVSSALAELPARQRSVVTLRDLDGLDADEVCALLGLSAGNQRVLLHRGRALVRSRLEDHFGDAARWGATP
ncbi:RNA polymerase sigma factor [Nocardioides cynanchi]|uniref:RNA polymerase sigma factor n=1 Tax=Nocardioides cynanchi TaxID=2558918 RepID=UPI001EE2F3C4|nr:sigma-70 family RNA polymerase sigma factor [Nocardioides cynanchi]